MIGKLAKWRTNIAPARTCCARGRPCVRRQRPAAAAHEVRPRYGREPTKRKRAYKQSALREINKSISIVDFCALRCFFNLRASTSVSFKTSRPKTPTNLRGRGRGARRQAPVARFDCNFNFRKPFWFIVRGVVLSDFRMGRVKKKGVDPLFLSYPLFFGGCLLC